MSFVPSRCFIVVSVEAAGFSACGRRCCSLVIVDLATELLVVSRRGWLILCFRKQFSIFSSARKLRSFRRRALRWLIPRRAFLAERDKYFAVGVFF